MSEAERPRRLAAWIPWVTFAVAVAWLCWGRAGVFEIYRDAGIDLLAGRPLYDGTGNGFVYFPTAAAAFAPFSILPADVGGAIWRILNVVVFAAGVRRLCLARGELGAAARFALAGAFALPLAWSAARLGQMTLCTAGLVLLGWGAAEDRAWGRSALALGLALALKPLALPFVAVAGLAHRPLRARLAAVLVALAALPFALQAPGYVAAQYGEVPRMLADVSAKGRLAHLSFANLAGLLGTLGLELRASATGFLGGLVTAVLCAVALGWRAIAERRRLPLAYGLVACCTLLASPATERNTYALLAPAIGLYAAEAVRRGGAPLAFAATLFALFLTSHPLGRAFPHTPLALGKPIACALFLWVVCARLARAVDASAIEVRSSGRAPRPWAP